MKPLLHNHLSVTAMLLSLATASALGGGVELHAGDLLISARNPLLQRPDVYVIRADGEIVSGGLLSGELTGAPPQLASATMLDAGYAALNAYSPTSNEMLYFSIFSDGGLEGGPSFTAPFEASMGIGSMISAQQLFSNPSSLQEYRHIAARPSYAVGQHPFRANHPTFFEDPLFGFEDPLFGFEDPLFGFEDPLFGFTANTLTVAYPNLGSSFDLEVTGGSVTAAIGYPRAWFVDPTTLDAFDGIDGEAAGIFAGFLVISEDADDGPGLYLAPLDRPSIENRDVQLYSYATDPIFSDPEFVIEGMHVDPVIPGQAYIWGTDAGRARGVVEPVIYRLNSDRTIEEFFRGGGLTAITDLIVAPNGQIYVVDNEDNGDGQIVRIDPQSARATLLAEGGVQFIDPVSISVVVAPIPTFTVNTTDDIADPVPGDGVVNNGFQRSLRAAIMEANAMGGAVNIVVPAGTYTLTLDTHQNMPYGADFYDLDIAGDIRIVGAGAGETIIDGNDLDRVFQVHPGFNLLLQGVTVQNGSKYSDGGGIKVDNASASIMHCELARNTGAGIYVFKSQADLFDTHIHRNNPDGVVTGGGVALYDSQVLIERCSIVENSAANGGGIAIRLSDADLINCTISSNDVIYDGGGVYLENLIDRLVRFRNCTIAFNQAATGGKNSSGGGVSAINFVGANIPIMQECIVAWNETDWLGLDDIYGSVEFAGNNSVYDNDNLTASGDLGGLVTGIDPWIRSSRTKIGNTEVNLPRNNSPIIDAGTLAGMLISDQVGNARPYDAYGNGVAIPDLGAAERQIPNCAADLNDTRTLDVFDVFAFLSLFNNAHPIADFTGDNAHDIFDVFAFLDAFNAGCP